MNPTNSRYKKKSITIWIVAGLVASFVFSVTGTFFPAQGETQTIFFKVDALFAISAFACLGSKATSEHFDIAAAGFTVLAIAQGLFLAEIDQPNHWNYESSTAGALFMIPSFLMISYYKIFPKWLRTSGLIITLPFILLVLLRHMWHPENTFIVESIVYISYQLITLCWAWQIWKKDGIEY